MSAVIGALRAELSASIAKFQEDMGKAAQEVQRFANRAEKEGKRIEGVGKRMSVALSLPLLLFAKTAVEQGKQSAQALGQIEAALASTGGQSGKTAAELQKSAKALERISLFDDDEILSKVTANLLAFGNVQGDVFERAQLSIVNLAAKMGLDLQAATIKVGKALQDPVGGLGALSKAGVLFNESQKEMLKHLVATGQGAKAQDIILKALESTVSGQAQALRANDPFGDMAQSFRELAEAAGPLIVDILKPMVEVVKALADGFTSLSPFVQKLIVGFLAIVAVIGPIVGLIGNIITLVGYLAPAFAYLGAALGAVSAVTWGWIAAIGAVLIALYALYKFIRLVVSEGFDKAWADSVQGAKDAWNDITGLFKAKPIKVPVEVVPPKGKPGGGLHFGSTPEQLAASKALETNLKSLQEKVALAFSKITVPASIAAAKDLNNQLDGFIEKAKEADVGTAAFANRIAGLRTQIEAFKQAALAKEAEKFTREVNANDLAVRKFASGGLDPLSEKLTSIDDAYQSLRDKIEAQIEDNRVLAESNDGAAAAMARLEKQLIDLGLAHDKASEGAIRLYAAENHLRDLQNIAEVNSTHDQLTDLKRARGQGAPLSSDMEKAQGIARELANQQIQSEIKLADLNAQRVAAETIGDTDELKRLDDQISAQTELGDLLKNTTAEQLHDAARVNDAWKSFSDSLSDSLANMLDDFDGSIQSIRGSIKQLAKELFLKPFTDQVSSGLSGLLKNGFGGGGGGGGGGLGEAFGGGDFIGSAADSGGSGFFSSLGSMFSGFFADGGFVPPGKWAIAGENGPEPIFGGHGGARVMSNPDAMATFGRRGDTTIGQTFNIGRMDQDTFRQTRRQVARAAKGVLG